MAGMSKIGAGVFGGGKNIESRPMGKGAAKGTSLAKMMTTFEGERLKL